MTEYKSIREWIAEGAKLSDLLGYVDENGNSISQILVTKEGMRVTLCRDGSIKIVRDGHLVAPPKPKSLSDEELLDEYDFSRFCNVASEVGRLRSKILDRMKAKGPTRGEVAMRLQGLLELRDTEAGVFRSSAYGEAYNAFLSMFPEGEE